MCAHRVPPTCFLSISTAYSSPWLAGLFHPENNHGVRYVSERSPRRKRRRLPSFPQRGSYPPKNSPYQQPYRITAAVTFLLLLRTLPLTSYRSSRSPHRALHCSRHVKHQPNVLPTNMWSESITAPGRVIRRPLYLDACRFVTRQPFTRQLFKNSKVLKYSRQRRKLILQPSLVGQGHSQHAEARRYDSDDDRSVLPCHAHINHHPIMVTVTSAETRITLPNKRIEMRKLVGSKQLPKSLSETVSRDPKLKSIKT